MLNEGEQKLHLLELYNKYNREDTLLLHTYSAAILITLGVGGLLVATTPLSGGIQLDGELIRVNKEILERRVINAAAGTVALGAEFGILRLAHKVSEARKHKIALEIAQAEERIPNETNDQRIMCTSALSSTLVYGIEFRPKFTKRLFNTYIQPILDGYRNIPPENRVNETFWNFDDGVDELPFDEGTNHEIMITALDLGRQRWEAIRRGKGSNKRLQGYSYVMLSEINNRLRDTLP